MKFRLFADYDSSFIPVKQRNARRPGGFYGKDSRCAIPTGQRNGNIDRGNVLAVHRLRCLPWLNCSLSLCIFAYPGDWPRLNL